MHYFPLLLLTFLTVEFSNLKAERGTAAAATVTTEKLAKSSQQLEFVRNRFCHFCKNVTRAHVLLIEKNLCLLYLCAMSPYTGLPNFRPNMGQPPWTQLTNSPSQASNSTLCVIWWLLNKILTHIWLYFCRLLIMDEIMRRTLCVTKPLFVYLHTGTGIVVRKKQRWFLAGHDRLQKMPKEIACKWFCEKAAEKKPKGPTVHLPRLFCTHISSPPFTLLTGAYIFSAW